VTSIRDKLIPAAEFEGDKNTSRINANDPISYQTGVAADFVVKPQVLESGQGRHRVDMLM
jgi:hypothetical protein